MLQFHASSVFFFMRCRSPLLLLVTALLLGGCDSNGDASELPDEPPAWAAGAPSFSSPEEVYTWEIDGGRVALFSDISVVPAEEGLRASFTCARYDATCTPTQICAATSEDGRTWTPDAVPLIPAAMSPQRYAWEGSELVTGENGGPPYLLASHYPYWGTDTSCEGGGVPGFPATLALFRDGAELADPLIARGSGEADNDAIYSPSVAQAPDGTYTMVYVGYCYDLEMEGISCPPSPFGVTLVGAKAPSPQGPWTRVPGPLLPDTFPISDGVYAAEPDLAWIDGRLYMAYSVMDSTENSRALGLAWSDGGLEGPWTWSATPIARAEEVAHDVIIAPSILWHEDRLRMWFTIYDEQLFEYTLGYVEGRFPEPD